MLYNCGDKYKGQWLDDKQREYRYITIFGEELFVNVKNEQTKNLIICNIVQNSDSIKVK